MLPKTIIKVSKMNFQMTSMDFLLEFREKMQADEWRHTYWFGGAQRGYRVGTALVVRAIGNLGKDPEKALDHLTGLWPFDILKLSIPPEDDYWRENFWYAPRKD